MNAGEKSDAELLRVFARGRSGADSEAGAVTAAEAEAEAAFTELVRRHAGAVQAAALRQTRNPALAGDVTHSVFLQLSRKAGSTGSRVVLIGWLLRAARYAAIDAVRAESRRARRESEFLTMQTLQSAIHAEDSHPGAEEESESLWQRIAPLLANPVGLQVRMMADGKLKLSLSDAGLSSRVKIEASTDLLHWESVGSSDSGLLVSGIALQADAGARFYRAVLPPE